MKPRTRRSFPPRPVVAFAQGAPVDEAAAKLTGVWIPDRVWKKFIDDTLAAHGKKADIF